LGADADEVFRIKLNVRAGSFVVQPPEPLTTADLDTFADELSETTNQVARLAADIQDQLGTGKL
jgi:hypothetical protein